MKKTGNISECHSQRTKELLHTYLRHISQCRHIKMDDVFDTVVNMPASQFWVSSERATVVMTKISRGDPLTYMRPTKREMFFEIYRRFVKLKRLHPDIPAVRLVERIVMQPAPKFYISPGSARIIILKARKRWHAEKIKRLVKTENRH